MFFLPGAPGAAPPPVIPPPPPRLLGHLQVNVTVSDTRVYVGDRLAGQASPGKPLNLPNLSVGKVKVRIEAKDHESQTRWIEIHHGQWSQPVFSLQPVKPASARLTVRSNVLGDSVYINDEYKGSTRLDLELAPGEYRMRVSKEGYEEWEQTIRLEAGARKTLRATLQREKDCWSRKVEGQVCTELTTGMEFVWVPRDCFRMGSNEGYADAKPVHEVCVNGFWMGKYEVTQGQWKRVMRNNPSYFQKGDNYPVENVSWNDTQEFIRRLNAKGNGRFRLPTEAEWEYACRSGGKQEKYCGGNDVNRVAWYRDNGEMQTHAAGKKSGNGLGLYDMSGNVSEWVGDWYDDNYYRESPKNNPKGPGKGVERVNRGGGWFSSPDHVRAALRGRFTPGDRLFLLGFRLLRTGP